MRSLVDILSQKFVEYSLPLTVFLVTMLAGSVLKRIIFRKLENWSKHTKTEIDDVVIAAIRSPFTIWCLMLGIYLALEFSPVPEEIVRVSGKALLVLGIASATLVIANIAVNLLRVYSVKAEGALPGASFTQTIARILIFGVGILIILNSLGISITPILATLGVGGLAVALALQETLSNLFAGFHVIAARQIQIGDYVKLDTGMEGYIIDINWRTTKIKMLPNNVILVPNAKLIQSTIINYHLPDKELSVPVEVGVHYNSDLQRVEKVTIDVARQVLKDVAGGVQNFEPSIRYHSFGDSSVNFTANLRVKEFTDQYLVKHEFIKRLHERYAKEGIVIPYPIRAINYEQEKAQGGAK